MTNLIFLGISPTTKVGQNNTAKADVALLNKETFDYKGEKRTRFNLIVATAWSGMIDRFAGCEVGDIIPNLELKGDSHIHQGKVYSSHTVISVDNTWLKKPLTPPSFGRKLNCSAVIPSTALSRRACMDFSELRRMECGVDMAAPGETMVADCVREARPASSGHPPTCRGEVQ